MAVVLPRQRSEVPRFHLVLSDLNELNCLDFGGLEKLTHSFFVHSLVLVVVQELLVFLPLRYLLLVKLPLIFYLFDLDLDHVLSNPAIVSSVNAQVAHVVLHLHVLLALFFVLILQRRLQPVGEGVLEVIWIARFPYLDNFSHLPS